jgi:hypothetical protein
MRMLKVPTPMPAAPTPVEARPRIRTVEVKARADMIEPTIHLVKISFVATNRVSGLRVAY